MRDYDFYAVIMAGGKGERFWPQSRSSSPKPLLKLVGDLTLIEQTVERLKYLFDPEKIIIITNQDYVAPMKSLFPRIPAGNIIGEPAGKDTAPCAALASAVLSARTKSQNTIMALLPADHVIKNNGTFLDVLKDSAEMAADGKIITIGVKPDFPSTGYGYIRCGEKIRSDLKTVFRESLGFKEKPDSETAHKFFMDASYKWNSGMFIWSLASIVDAFEKYAPSLAKVHCSLKKAEERGRLFESLPDLYSGLEKTSIDYAIMEKAENVLVAECSFYWDDVGSWLALKNQVKPSENNNIIKGLHFGIDTKNCIIAGDSNHLIGTVDVSDLIIINTNDVTLVCHTKSAQKIKELVRELSSNPELSRFV